MIMGPAFFRASFSNAEVIKRPSKGIVFSQAFNHVLKVAIVAVGDFSAVGEFQDR